MIRRFYVNNFRCLENFELNLTGKSSTLLIGRNGSGKSTVGLALGKLQKIARGTNRIADLLTPAELSRGRDNVPIRFELEVELESAIVKYELALELPKGFREMRVLEETLSRDGDRVFERKHAQVTLVRQGSLPESKFNIDWHLVALPIIHAAGDDHPVGRFNRWLSRMLILRPIPELINGESIDETLFPEANVSNFGAWFSGLLGFAPSAYSTIDAHLRDLMPDFRDVKNPQVAKDARSLQVQFSTTAGSLTLPFASLSDGEKCFMICALVLAANEQYGPICCFWDEPDNYLVLPEVGHFVTALRKTFQGGGQLIATSHNPEAIRRFSDENTLVLDRKSHIEPTLIRSLAELEYKGDLVDLLIRGDARL